MSGDQFLTVGMFSGEEPIPFWQYPLEKGSHTTSENAILHRQSRCSPGDRFNIMAYIGYALNAGFLAREYNFTDVDSRQLLGYYREEWIFCACGVIV